MLQGQSLLGAGPPPSQNLETVVLQPGGEKMLFQWLEFHYHFIGIQVE